MTGEGLTIVGPYEKDGSWVFYLKTNYVECCDAPVAVYDFPMSVQHAIQWTKQKLPQAKVDMDPNNYVEAWDSAIRVFIDNQADAAIFKLMWGGR